MKVFSGLNSHLCASNRPTQRSARLHEISEGLYYKGLYNRFDQAPTKIITS